jgi:Tfp pilus assembly protein PilO
MQQDQPVRRWILLIVVLLGITGAYLTYTSTDQDVQAAELNLETITGQYHQDLAAIGQIPTLTAKRAELRKSLSSLAAGNNTAPALMEYLQTIAKRRNVVITNLTFIDSGASGAPTQPVPRPPAPTTVGTPSPTSPMPAPQTHPIFAQQPFSMVITGGYKSVLFALADLSSGPVLVQVDPAPGVQSTEIGVKMTINATLFETDSPILRSGQTLRSLLPSGAPPKKSTKSKPQRAGTKSINRGEHR